MQRAADKFLNALRNCFISRADRCAWPNKPEIFQRPNSISKCVRWSTCLVPLSTIYADYSLKLKHIVDGKKRSLTFGLRNVRTKTSRHIAGICWNLPVHGFLSSCRRRSALKLEDSCSIDRGNSLVLDKLSRHIYSRLSMLHILCEY